MKALALVALGLTTALILSGQTNAEPIQFEVATVKPVAPDGMHTMGVQVYPGGRVVIQSFSLKLLICTAFDVSYWQLAGGEDWTSKIEYTVEGVPPQNMRPGLRNTRHDLFTVADERLRQMLQALLIDRFQLKFHRDTKIGAVYLMERNGKKSLLLRPNASTSSEANPSGDAAGSIGWAERWVLSNVTMQQLAKFASAFELHSPVLDRTELTGSFDYESPAEDVETYRNDSTGSFLNMIGSIGLKMVPVKGAVETFVIDGGRETVG